MSNSNKSPIRLKYDASTATYASQALVQAGPEEVFIDFSSGFVNEGNNRVLPVHTRIALNHAAARRLLGALAQTLQRHTDGVKAAIAARNQAAAAATTEATEGETEKAAE